MTDTDTGGVLIWLGLGWGIGTYLGQPGAGVAITSVFLMVLYVLNAGK